MAVAKQDDCLLNCLREVRLEKFHKNFVERGLTNCDQLGKLSMDQYSTYGVMSMDDRRRLFSIIQIIKSVKADGLLCNHGNNFPDRKSNLVSSVAAKPAESAKLDGNMNLKNRQSADVGFAPRKLNLGEARSNGNAFVRHAVNNGQNNNYKAKFDRIREEDLKMKQLVSHNNSDSPLFQCKKTLNFSDPDLYSDEEECSEVPMNPHPQCPSSTVSSKKLAPSCGESTYKIVSFSGESKHNLAPAVAESTSGTAFAATLVFDSKPVTNESSPRRFVINLKSSKSEKTDFDDGNHIMHNSRYQSRSSSENNHAYFPISEADNHPSKPAHVEEIHHNGGYNYGIPENSNAKTFNASETKFDDKTSILQQDKIRVCIRKRPRNMKELKRNELDIVKIRGRQTVAVEEFKVAVDLTRYIHQHVMKFDEVFDEKCCNKEVYDRAVKPLITCVFEKSSAICFAFGQTGAGKTHTLMGTKTVAGMYQLAGEDLFAIAHSGKYREPLRLWISFYEIYCGHLFDLLNKRKRLHVRENGKQKVCIAGLMENPVEDVVSLVKVINYGNSFRSRGSTGVNPNSSRSHAVLQMDVRDGKENKIGRLTFIDLAGSERASDATNLDRQTRIEGAEINQSLLALKECIRSIDQDSSHTPYRQSKLTHILRDSFLGNSQSVMIANISPTQNACENTLNTLRYADRVQELRKEVALKSATVVGQSQTSTLNHEIPDIMTKKHAPSLFHPSDIQYTSTPMKNSSSSVNQSHVTRIDCTSPISSHTHILPNLKNNSHQMSSEHSLSNGVQSLVNERVNPISISPIAEIISHHQMHCGDQRIENGRSNQERHRLKEAAVISLERRNSNGTIDMESQRMEEMENESKNNETCWNDHHHLSQLDDELLKEHRKIKSHAEMVISKVKSVIEHASMPHLFGPNVIMSSDHPNSSDPTRLVFYETKTCMENARDNIRDFLDNEKKNRMTLKPDLMIVQSDERETFKQKSMSLRQISEDNSLQKSSGAMSGFLSEGEQIIHRSKTSEVHRNYDVKIENGNIERRPIVNEKRCEDEIKEMSDAATHLLISNSEILSVYEESNGSHQNLNQQQMNGMANSPMKAARSWADILGDSHVGRRDSSDGCSNKEPVSRQGSSSILSENADSTNSDPAEKTDDISHSLISEEVRTLKLKIRELKLQKERLERNQNETKASERIRFNANSSSSEEQFIFEEHLKLPDIDVVDVEVGTQRRISFDNGVLSFANPNSSEKRRSSSPLCRDVQTSVDRFNRDILHIVKGPSIPGGLTEQRTLEDLAKEIHDSVATMGKEQELNTSDILNGRHSDIGGSSKTITNPNVGYKTFAFHENSAFTEVKPSLEKPRNVHKDERRQNWKPLEVTSSEAFQSSLSDEVSMANEFEPIESAIEIESNTNNVWRAIGRSVVDNETEIKQLQQELASQRARNLLVMAHEDQLTEITRLCKEEMTLLMNVRIGQLNYDDYMQNVREILERKSNIIETLVDHINEFDKLGQCQRK